MTPVMRGRVVVVVAVVLFAAACSSTAGGSNTGTDGDSAQVMAAAVTELLTRDNTFGEGPPPFTTYLLQANLDPTAGTVSRDPNVRLRPVIEAERWAIEAALRSFGPVQWIGDPAEWITEDLLPKIEGAVILGVGEPIFDGDGALVPVSLWCGGLCGTWLTYRLVQTDEGWQVTGVEGPIAVS